MPRPSLLALALGAGLLLPATVQAQRATPDSATVAAGKKLFEGPGVCAACHGMKGEGILGPTLMLHAGKEKWLHHDGTWDGITKLISGGVDGSASKSGQVMPPKGGSQLTDAQVRQVAAYVLVMHRSKPKS